MESSREDRVVAHSPGGANEDIRRRTEEAAAGAATDAERRGRRLRQLEREWDIERALFAITSVNMLLGLALTRWVDRRWLGYVAAVGAFQLQHAVQGWCPPVPVLRHLGYRTRREIDDERVALKALRGDFDGLRGGAARPEVTRALDAARR